jgi:hypothetical protein
MFELKHIAGPAEEAEPPTDLITSCPYKDYLQLVQSCEIKQIYRAMAKTNAKVKVDQVKGKIYADYNIGSRDSHDLVLSCQAYKLTEQFSFIVFKKEAVTSLPVYLYRVMSEHS